MTYSLAIRLREKGFEETTNVKGRDSLKRGGLNPVCNDLIASKKCAYNPHKNIF